MSQFDRELAAFEQRRKAGAKDNNLRRERAAENLTSFIRLMAQREIPTTACYKQLDGLHTYMRIGAGWIISEASEPRDRTGSIVLVDGNVYDYTEQDGRRAAEHIIERPFVVALQDHNQQTMPSDPINYGDGSGAQSLQFAAHRLGAI